MKKWVRILAITIGAVLALGALAVLGLNVYIQRPATQSRIEEKAGQRLGMPLKITGASLTPWGGLRLESARVPQTGQGSDTGNFLETSGFVARFKLLPLFAGRLEVTSVNLSNPKVVWVQNARGKWRLPQLAKAVPNTAAPENRNENSPRPKMQFTIDRFRVKGGTFDFFDKKHARVASFAGLELDAPAITADSVSGTARCPATSVADVVFPKNFRTPFVYRDSTLKLSGIETDVAGGRVAGDFQIIIDKADSPYVADVRLENVDVNRLLVEAGGEPGQVTGALGGWLDLYGITRGTDAIGGSGRIILQNGHVRENAILQIIGQVLQIDELARLDLSEAQADFLVASGSVWIDPLVLQSPNLKLTVRGSIRLEDKKIAADARLEMNQKITAKIPAIIGNQLKRAENGDGSYIDFAIRGTVDKPKTDLAERLIGDRIEKQLTGFLESLGLKKKDRDETKKPKKIQLPEPVPPVAPPPAVPVREPEAGQ